jgi:MFS family permease
MKTGIFFLVISYLLSQFYRAFLAVLTPMLSLDLGASPSDLATASGLWFFAFAAMQIPVGWSLDTFGPRRTASVLLGIGGAGGAFLFATATDITSIYAAMILIGVGCSPVLMAAYYIFGRTYPPVIFATLAASVIGFGSLGNIAGAWPLAWAAETFGWRSTVGSLAVVTLLSALALAVFVQDPPKVDRGTQPRGSLLDLLRLRALWVIAPLMLVNYVPAAGIRGLWISPYFIEVYGAAPSQIGIVTLLMAIAMVVGSFTYGPLDRIFGTRKYVILVGNIGVLLCLLILMAFPLVGFWSAAMLLMGIGFFGASFPLIMAHGRSFVPPHLLGRGVTLLNLFGIGGVAIMQLLSGGVYAMAPAGPPEVPFQLLFGFFAIAMALGVAIYAFSTDRTD